MLPENLHENKNKSIYTDKERKKIIKEICNAECANCENWDKQKQCSACEIFKALSEVNKQ